MARAALTRAVHFAAAHLYSRPEWSEAENRRRFGRFAEDPPHTHHYRCEVTVTGEVHPETGMVVDLGTLDALLRHEVVDRLHGALLHELPDFQAELAVPTTENIARVVWARLANRLPDGCRLAEVRIHEESDLSSTYRGA